MEMMIRTGAQGQHAFCSDDARLFGRSPADGTPQAGFRPYPSPSAKAKARQKPRLLPVATSDGATALFALYYITEIMTAKIL